MDDHQLPHALLKQSSCSVTDRDGIQATIRLTIFESCRFARLNLIEDAIVHMLESGADDLDIALAVFADDVHAGFGSGSLRSGQEAGCFGAEFRVWLIQRIEEQQIAQMK